MFFDRSKFCEQFSKRVTQGTSCEIISKSDELCQRRRILKNISQVHTVKPPPLPNGGHVFRQIKISQTIFEKGCPRNNPGYQHFLLFPQCFQKPSFQRVIQIQDFEKGLFHYHTMPHFDALKIYS